MLASLVVASPIGELTLVASDTALVALQLPNSSDPKLPADTGATPLLTHVATQLDEYFAGTRRVFSVPLEPTGTPFQQRVWAALLEIPFGVQRSYGDVARAIGQPTASRAVGAANGDNPIAIIVPCHRVIGSTGKLTGYGGGLPIKSWLLAHERRHASGQQSLFA